MKPRAWLSMLRMALASRMQFRAAFWSRLLLSLFWALVRAAIIVAFYTLGSSDSGGVTMEQTVGMSWLSQIALILVGGVGFDYILGTRIRTGDIALDMLRPFHLYAYMFAHVMADKLSRFLPFALPLLAVALLVPGGYGLMPPVSAGAALSFALTLATGLVLSCACEMLSLGANMDLRYGSNISNMINTVMQVLSGVMIPLQLFPDAWQTALRWQPFAGMVDLPTRLYVGSAELSNLPFVLGVQLIWALAAMALGVLWVNKSARRMTLQGG